MNASESQPATPVAIIGMGCLFPKAANREAFWANILDRVDAIGDVPSTHWRPEDYFNADPKAPDLTYARRGGFLSPVDFPPLDFGISPNSLEATDSTQLLGLMAARQALEDAGYGSGRDFDRTRVSTILGVTGTLPLVIPLGARLGHPQWRRALKDAGVPDAVAEDVVARIGDSYVGWQEDSFPGLLGNVVAGRIANRLDLGGTNCVVDAACASSLSALHLATYELAAGRADLVLTGGMDAFNDIFMYMCFSKTPALSPTGNAKPFDATADGTILGEGFGCLVLKRLDDARRDGDRIYAVIRGVGTSSDGKGNAIYAPSPTGQMRALRQAYRLAGVTPDSIELVEAHGTGTRAGDTAEASALNEVYRSAQPQGSWCALGSVKSQIGHTKAAAGAAGLIKTALALYHKVLPPTIKVSQPIELLAPGRSPFYVNTEERPWLPRSEHPRRAAVSSFGFGGSNFHCVLEEYRPEKERIDWDSRTQILAFSADSPATLQDALARWPAGHSWEEARIEAARNRAAFRLDQPCRVVLALSRDRHDVGKLLDTARTLCGKLGDKSFVTAPEGVFVGRGRPAGKLAMLFPGQGSQYVGMFRELACRFPQVQQVLADADSAFTSGSDGRPVRLSDLIYPQPVFRDEDRIRDEEALRSTEVTQPALGAVSLGALRILAHFGVRPEAVAGHSYGELVALHAAGRIDAPSLHKLSRLRGRLMGKGAGDRGAMLAVQAPLDVVEKVLREDSLKVIIANKNAPRQSVLSGGTVEVRRAAEAFARRNITAKMLPVSAAFHSPLVAEVRKPFQAALADVAFAAAELPVFSNTTAGAYPHEPQQARSLLAGQIAEPVAFVDEIGNMHRSGVRTFLEVGPGGRLTTLVGAILEGKEHVALAVDASSGQRGGVLDLARTLAQLAALGHPVDLTRWDDAIDVKKAERATKKPALTVPICGANYVKPRPQRPAVTSPQAPCGPVGTGREAASTETVGVNAKPPSERDDARPFGESSIQLLSAVETVVVKSEVGPSSPPVPEASFLSQALRTTQENLIALQKLGEQTARLHGQFLENQSRALGAFQALLEHQQRLFGVPQSVPLPAPSPAVLPVPQRMAARRVPAEVPIPPPSAEPTKAVSLAPAAAQGTATAAIAAPPVVAPAPQESQSTKVLLAIVADKTGYPAEMLGLDMELDADLGIDSIKRVEIFSTVQEKLPHAPVVKPEHLGTLRTLRQVVEFLGGAEQVADAVQPAATRPEPAVAAAPAQPASGEMVRVLLDVVADKTGYPAEMLGLDMELDADLGIDSIKRVEIFSTVQEKLPHAPVVKPEHLGTLRTLRQVVEFLGGSGGGSVLASVSSAAPVQSAQEPQPPTETPLPVPASELPNSESSPLKRYTLQPAELATSGRKAITPDPKHEIWITEDEGALAGLVSARLGFLGYRTRLIAWKDIGSLTRPAALSGLLILTPYTVDDRVLENAFHLLQIAEPGLRQAGKAGGAVLATVSRMDGSFALREPGDPLSGGLAGLTKTASHEWPEVSCKALDVPAGLKDADEAALAIAEEMFLAGPVEVGITTTERHGLRLTETPIDTADRSPPLRKGDVVVISGGARGVTAEVAVALAREFAPTLVLLGRSPEPRPEPEWLAPLKDASEIKRALLARAPGQAVPREIGEQCRSWLANREMLGTLQRIQSAGAQVVYRSVDVRDATAVRSLMDSIRASLGPIHGLIHGAGVLADRRIEDKTAEQFALVYATKVVGLRSLLGAVERDELKVLALFSSSTGRFGRTGQVDYAVANEVLNKVAQQEARRRPACRVVSVNWGPWDGGMVTPSLRGVFQNEGVGLISLQAGAAYFVREISTVKDRAVEVVVVAGDVIPGSAEVNAVPEAPALALAVERPLSLDLFPVLRSHVLANRAVLPVALTVDLLAHGALHGNPGLTFHGFNDLRVLKGVRLAEDQSWRLRILAGKATRQDAEYLVPVELHSSTPDGREVPNARAVVVLSARLPKPMLTVPELTLESYDREIGEIYRDLLFHGPDFQGVRSIEGLSASGCAASVAAAPPPASWIKQPLRGTWLADPLVLDSAFQLMVLWTFESHGSFSLPSFAGRYRQYRRNFPAEGTRVVAAVKQSSAHRALADLWFLDRSGEVIACMHDYECVIDASLNQAFRRNQLTSEVSPSV